MWCISEPRQEQRLISMYIEFAQYRLILQIVSDSAGPIHRIPGTFQQPQVVIRAKHRVDAPFTQRWPSRHQTWAYMLHKNHHKITGQPTRCGSLGGRGAILYVIMHEHDSRNLSGLTQTHLFQCACPAASERARTRTLLNIEIGLQTCGPRYMCWTRNHKIISLHLGTNGRCWSEVGGEWGGLQRKKKLSQ